MRKKIAAGNWKMNLLVDEATSLASAITEWYSKQYQGEAEVILAVPAPYLSLVHAIIGGHKGIYLAGQNVHQEASGAYTGENSAAMIAGVGATHCLVGHSERRQYFGEDNALLAKKIDRLLATGLVPIYCIGESLQQREAGQTLEVIRSQLSEGAFHLPADAFGQLIVAYEPVWAIGTGVTATPEQAQEVHAYIRSLIEGQYGPSVAANTSVLYGGSVKPANAAALFAQPDIDGGLVGGASLKAPDFIQIIQAL
ncbi:MAG: triose-phosphate isomerase [Bacteroidetes bacterium]|nr:MAG: triose-phosphate isomerase [Bacteroidota bacterium]